MHRLEDLRTRGDQGAQIEWQRQDPLPRSRLRGPDVVGDEGRLTGHLASTAARHGPRFLHEKATSRLRRQSARYFSFRWVPFGIDAEADPESEPTTLVEFLLEAVPEGTRLTVVESGFDQVPAHRRARAFRMNEGGWAAQGENLRRYVEGA